MFVRAVRNDSDFRLPKGDENRQRKRTSEKAKLGATTLERIIAGDSSKNGFLPQETKITYLTECFADFVTHLEGEGYLMPKITPCSTVVLSPCRVKHAWMRVLATPWLSRRRNSERKLETVIWIDSYLQYSKHCVALCGYPLVLLSSSLLELSDFGWFWRIFYHASLMIGYLSPCHLLLEKILAWYCKRYVISDIREDFFRLDLLDDTTHFLYHCQNEVPDVGSSADLNGEGDGGEVDFRWDVFVSKENRSARGHLLSSEYQRTRTLAELLSNSGKKMNFHAIVEENTENWYTPIVSVRNDYEKALPVVNKSYILSQLNKALRLDWYTCGVLVLPFVLFPTHQMCIFAYSYYILLEHYYHRIHLSVTDVLKECKQIIEMEREELCGVLTDFYDFVYG